MSKRTIVTHVGSLFSLLLTLLSAVPGKGSEPVPAAATGLLEAIDATGNTVALPTPPERLARLIELGNVRFEFYDPKVAKRSSAGETRFEFHYTYKSHSDWKLIRRGGHYAIDISIRYRDVQLQRTHRVLLPQTLFAENLFERGLTLHEFDHVAISSDERLPALLRSVLQKKNASIVKILDEQEGQAHAEPTPAALSRISERLVQEASDKVFNDFVALVTIRYSELDRVSQSGLKPMSPEDRYRIVESPLTP